VILPIYTMAIIIMIDVPIVLNCGKDSYGAAEEMFANAKCGVV